MRNKRTTRKKRIVSTLLAATVTFSVVLAGTYAWRSVSQKALNEAKSSLNPGARLHDDFNGMNLSSAQTTDNGSTDRKVKYVYVENFTDAQKQTMVYARIRLDEYLETGTGAGKPSNDATKSAQSLVAGATMENKSTWTPYKWDNDQTFRKYVTLSTGGETVYMPTFNKDQDSLEADINGTLGGLDKNIETDTDDYSDYVKYTYDAAGTNTSKVTDIEVYDAEGDGLDKVKEAGLDVETIAAAVKDPTTGKFNVAPNATSITIDGRNYTVTKMEPDTISTSADITAIYVDLDPTTTGVTPQADIILKTAEHTAQMTLDTDPSLDAASTPGIMSMTDWNALPQADKIGKYWVYDSEGWLYWAEPIEPSTATGCLLNSIAINDTTPDGKSLQSTEYYYGLNVVAQFATAGDWGEKADKTGFYKDGLTAEGEKLLNTIAAKENPGAAYEVGISLQNANQTVAPGSNVPLSVKVENLQTGQDEAFDPTQISWSIDWTASQSVEEKGGRTVTVHPTSIDENGVLTIAENETAKTLVVVATYNYDTTNVKKTVEGRITINVDGELTYPITINPTAMTEATKGESIQFTATVNKQIADGTPGATTDGTTTWSVVDAETGNALSGTTTAIDQNGTLTIDLAETAKALKIIATYTVEYKDESGASQGKKQWTAEKTITLKDCSYTMADITKTGKAEPGTTIQYKTSVTRTNGSTAIGNAINSGTGRGITWSLVGTPSDQDASTGTKLDPQTGILTIGVNEKNANLTVKASFKDPLNPNVDGSANIEKTTTVGTILTTKYTIEKTAQDYSAALVQGDDVTYTVKVKKDNGTDAGNYVSDPAVKWSLSGNKTSTTKADVTATDATEKKQKLTIGAKETGTVKLTASYTGASDLVLHNTEIQKLTYIVTLGGGATNLVQEDTATYTVSVKKENGRYKDGVVTTDASKLNWALSNQTSGAGSTVLAGKLTVGAKEAAKTNLRVRAMYTDANNNGVVYSAESSDIKVTASTYSVDITVPTTKSRPCGSGAVSVTVKKTNGQKAGILTQNVSDVTWTVSGKTGTMVNKSTGMLIIAGDETAGSITVQAKYSANNGTTPTSAVKTVAIELDPQINAKNASVGEKVTIGSREYWKIYEGTSSGQKVALMWSVEPDNTFSGTYFNYGNRWTGSNAQSYLNGNFINNDTVLSKMKENGIIKQATNYTRGSWNDSSWSNRQATMDYVFLLSEADLTGYVNYNYSGKVAAEFWEYSTYGVTGQGIQLLTNLSDNNKATIMNYTDISKSRWSWLRSPCDNNGGIAIVSDSASVGYAGYTDSSGVVRPAFWMYI